MKQAALAFFLLLLSFPVLAAEEKESAYERVMRTGTIRCGYTIWNPVLTKDPESGTLGGFAYDVMNEVARRLFLKIEWTEESDMDLILEGISTGRYDMVCLPFYMVSPRARVVYFSVPLYFSPLYIVTRSDDIRFDKDYRKLNDPQYRIAMLEGQATAVLGRQRFPRATPHVVPQIQGYGFVLKDIDLRKADATISDTISVSEYNEHNDDHLKYLPVPLSVSVMAFPLPKDMDFKQMIDTALTEVVYDGWLENLFTTEYPRYKSFIIPVKPDYEITSD